MPKIPNTYRGVSKYKPSKDVRFKSVTTPDNLPFMATVTINGKTRIVGYAESERAAAILRDKAILENKLKFPLQVLKPKN